jgi:MerR family mercuric resistance operon transcriptional regulator
MSEMTIGVLAKAAGVHVETIRYYQRRGLLDEPRRPSGGVRRYGEDAVARLRFIRRAQDMGFSLDEVKVLLQLERTPGCRDARALAATKLAAVDKRMADLQKVKTTLRQLVAQCDAGGERSCPIIASLSGVGALTESERNLAR